jgi:hypothetical protein
MRGVRLSELLGNTSGLTILTKGVRWILAAVITTEAKKLET